MKKIFRKKPYNKVERKKVEKIIEDVKNITEGKDVVEAVDKYFHTEARTDLEKFIQAMIPAVTATMGLGKINFFFNTVKNEEDVKNLGVPSDPDEELVMCIKYREQYRSAYVSICPAAAAIFKNGDKKLIRHSFVHEVAHIVTNRLAEVANMRSATSKEIRDAVENATESVAMMARTSLQKSNPGTVLF